MLQLCRPWDCNRFSIKNANLETQTKVDILQSWQDEAPEMQQNRIARSHTNLRLRQKA